MGEPLFDGITAAIVLLGIASVVVLRAAAAEATNARRSLQRDVAGHLLLGVAVSLLLYRWVSSAMTVTSGARPSVWLSGTLVAACGLGIVAAVKSVVGVSTARRTRDFAITVVCGAIALSVVSAWEWAVLLLTLLTAGVAIVMWRSTRNHGLSQTINGGDQHREPVLVGIVSAALLLLFLGTWQHVFENETHRRTRSPRYSAWPRATALRNAWERTDWVPRPSDDESSRQATIVSAHELRIAMGMGTLLLVLIASTWFRTNSESEAAEAANLEASDAV